MIILFTTLTHLLPRDHSQSASAVAEAEYRLLTRPWQGSAVAEAEYRPLTLPWQGRRQARPSRFALVLFRSLLYLFDRFLCAHVTHCYYGLALVKLAHF